jgi:hypothetical protein
MLNCNKDGASAALRNNSRFDAMSNAIGEIDISDDDSTDEDDELFQIPPPKDDCEICFLPMPFSPRLCGVINQIYHPCCGKVICTGCIKQSIDEMHKGNLKRWCPFCRQPLIPLSPEKGYIKRIKKRMKKNDAEAFYTLGCAYRVGHLGLSTNLNKALELLKRAAELGSIRAHYDLATFMFHGRDGAEKDKKKSIQHYKVAAIGGHEMARHNLGMIEMSEGNINIGIKHFMISASSGYEKALEGVGKGYKAGFISKDQYASTLRAYQQTTNQMKSKEREEARAHYASR